MQLGIQGQKCKKHITPSSYKKKSVHISLFIGNRDKSALNNRRPKSSVLKYVQRKIFTPVANDSLNKDMPNCPFYMPKMSKTPSPLKATRFFYGKARVQSAFHGEVVVPAELALKNLYLAKECVTKALNLSINIGKIQTSPNGRRKKAGTGKIKVENFQDGNSSLIHVLKK